MGWETIESGSSAHDFSSTPELIANFEKTDTVDTEDRFNPGQMRSSTIHRFLDNGVRVDVWGSADLDAKMRAVKPGSLVRIKFEGVEDLPGGKTIKRFTVQVDTASVPLSRGTVNPDDDIPF